MSSCWSCLVIIEKGAKVCPFCNADQTRPVVHVPVEAPNAAPRFGTPALKRAVIALGLASAILAAVCAYVFIGGGPSAASVAEDTAVESLIDVRADLSTYALSSGKMYPETLESLGANISESIDAARAAGYEISYTPKESADQVVRAYELVASAHNPKLHSFYIDQSGVIRESPQDRPANQDDPPI